MKISHSNDRETLPDFGIAWNAHDCGPNNEVFSFHPGGANVLLMDGSVRFLKETTNGAILCGLITKNEGEIISADSF